MHFKVIPRTGRISSHTQDRVPFQVIPRTQPVVTLTGLGVLQWTTSCSAGN